MKTFLFVVTTAVLAAALPCILPAQNNTADQPLVDFAGTWRGICQDGNPFVILSIKVSGGALAGDITIANMQGGNGQCATVIDPPSPDHAMKIDGARVRGNVFSFQGSQKARFEMSLAGTQTARLKFLGTPVEDAPWKLVKSADSSR
jgi:hypothetical protein